MGDTALLVVDVQSALIESGPFRAMETIGNIRDLIESARGSGTEIIYIRHDSGKTGFTAVFKGYEIHEALAPKAGEHIFDKRFNSAFLGTDLHGHLQDKGIKNIILTGLRTEYCVDATCKAAFERGYLVYVPKGAHTTFDNGPFSAAQLIAFYEDRIWNNRFAKVLSRDGLKTILYPQDFV